MPTETFHGKFLDKGGQVFHAAHPDFGCVADGAANDTVAVQATLDTAKAAGGGIAQLPPGIITITAPLVSAANVWLRGAGRNATIISKVNTSTYTGVASGVTKDCAVYVDSGVAGTFALGSRISDLKLVSASSAANSCAFFLGVVAQSQYENINAQGFYSAVSSSTVFLVSLTNIRGGSNFGYSFDFSSADEKTSLSLEACFSEASAGGYAFNQAKYSSLRGCAADLVNSGGAPVGAAPQPRGYGTAAKGDYTLPSTIYQFNASTVAMDGCGAEFCHGSYVTAQGGSFITLDGCYAVEHRLNVGGTTLQAFAAVLDVGPTDNRITINGCGFGNGGVLRTGASTQIYGYYVPTGNPLAQIVADRIDVVSGGGLAAQTSGRVYDLSEVARGTVPTLVTVGDLVSARTSIAQATGVATTHYALTVPGVYSIAAYGHGGVNFAAHAVLALSSTGAITILRNDSSHGSFAISVSGANVQVTQSNGTTVTVSATKLNLALF